METVDVVLVESCDLFRSDILHGRNEMHHLREIAAHDVEGIIFIAIVILGCRKVHEIHRDNGPEALGDRERFSESISSRGSSSLPKQ
jgi:hypothetical protein